MEEESTYTSSDMENVARRGVTFAFIGGLIFGIVIGALGCHIYSEITQ